MDPKKIDLREAPPPLPLMSQEAYENFQNDQFLPGEKDMFGFRPIPQEHDLEMFQFDDGQAQAAAGQAQAAAGQAQAAAGQAQAAAGQAAQGPKSLAELLDLRKRQKKFTDLERQLALGDISVDEYKQKVTSLNLSEDERDEAGLFLLQEQGHGGKRKSKKYRYNKKSKTDKRHRSRSRKRSRRRSRT